MNRSDQQQRLWAEQDELLAERDYLNTVTEAKREDLLRTQALVADAEARVSEANDKKFSVQRSNNDVSNLDHECLAELQSTLTQVITELVQKAGSRTGATFTEDREIVGSEEEKTIAKVVDNFCHAAEDLADLQMGKTFAKAACRVTIHRILADGRDERFDVLVSPKMQFKDLVQIALNQWSIKNENKRDQVWSLIDEAGSTWPARANVFRDICERGSHTASLYLDTKDNVQFKPQFSTGNVSLLTDGESKLKNTVAPLLGEYAVAKALKARQRAAQDGAPKLSKRNTEVEQIQTLGRVAVVQMKVSWFKRLIDAFASMILLGIVFVYLSISDITISNEIGRTFQAIETTKFTGSSGTLISFRTISNWQDVRLWSEGPLYNSINRFSSVVLDSRQLLRLIVPVRVLQQRSRLVPRDDYDFCPTFRKDVLEKIMVNANPYCVPELSHKTRATSFFQGQPSNSPGNLVIDSLSPEARNKWLFRENSDNLRDRLRLPPDSSQFEPGIANSDQNWGISASFLMDGPYGYLQDIPIEDFDSSADAVFGFLGRSSNGTLEWLDQQTRHLRFSIGLYSSDFERISMQEYSINLDQSGAFTTYSFGGSIKDVTESDLIMIYTLTALSGLILIYFGVLLTLYARGHYEVERVVANEKENARRMRRITQTIDNVYAATEQEEVRISKWSVFLYWLVDRWVIINLFIIILVMFASFFAIISVSSHRFLDATFPSVYFINFIPNATWAMIGRILGTHAIVLLVWKILFYMPREFFDLIEPDAMAKAFMPLVNIGCAIFVIICSAAFAKSIFPGGVPLVSFNVLSAMLTSSFFLFGMSSGFAGTDELEPQPKLNNASIGFYFTYFVLYLVLYLFLSKFIVGICHKALSQVSIKRLEKKTNERNSNDMLVPNQDFTQYDSYWKTTYDRWYHSSKTGKPLF